MALHRRDNEQKHRREESSLAIVLGRSNVSSAKVQRLALVRWAGLYRCWRRLSRMNSRRSLKLVEVEDEAVERRKMCAREKTCRSVADALPSVVQVVSLGSFGQCRAARLCWCGRLWRRTFAFDERTPHPHPLDPDQTIVCFECNNTIKMKIISSTSIVSSVTDELIQFRTLSFPKVRHERCSVTMSRWTYHKQ